jgi:hypothetical protein
MHAMRSPGQTPEQAQQSTSKFITSSLALAHLYQSMQHGGGFSNKALYAFGQALHTLMDSLSPTHRGTQPWDPFNLPEVVKHIEGEKSITSDEMKEAIGLAQGAFQSVFGSVSVSQDPTSSQSFTTTTLFDGPLSGFYALDSYGGPLYIEGINLTGIF